MSRPSLVLAAFALACLAPRSGSAAPLTPADRAHVEKLILRRVFPGPTQDSGIACTWGQATCVPYSTHLDFADSSTVPTLAACQGTTTLQTCYKAAVTRVQDALTAGDVAILFEAAYRTKDVIARAKVTAAAPAWLKQENATNLLYQFFAGQGLPLDQIGNCRTGTVDAKYTCLGSLPRPIYRAGLAALDRHNATLVRNGQLDGARARTLAIFRGGVAPMTVGMAARNAFDPSAGAGAAGIEQLGKFFFLRAYEGLMTGSDPDAEVDVLRSIPGFKPAGLASAPKAPLMIVAANRGGGRSNKTAGTFTVLDNQLHADAAELTAIGNWTRALVGVQGNTAAMMQADSLVGVFAESMANPNLDQAADAGYWAALDDVMEEAAVDQASGYSDSCGWLSIDPVMGLEQQLVEVTYEETYIDQECMDELWDDCMTNMAPKGADCNLMLPAHRDLCRMTRSVTEMQWKDVEVQIGEDMGTRSLRQGYWDLLESNTTDDYDFDGDNKPDLNYTDPVTSSATIANAGVWAGNATSGCLGELSTLGSAYSAVFTVYGDGAKLDGAGPIDEDLTDPFGSTVSNEDFIPYPIATRICPAYTRMVIGLGSTFVPMARQRAAVNQQTGGATNVSVGSCDTPWAYTNRVADLLGDASMWAALEEMEDDLVGVESLATTIADFVVEAELLAIPIAGGLQQRADLAYLAGDVPNGDDGDWYSDNVGLDNLSNALDAAAVPLGQALDLIVEFGGIETGVAGASGRQAIAEKSQSGFNTCNNAGCVDNARAHTRGLFYRRLRDALDLYQRNTRDRLEMLWRRLDGSLGECLLVIPEIELPEFPGPGPGPIGPLDPPGGLSGQSHLVCTAAVAGCADICDLHAGVDALVGDAAADMAAVRDMLTAQETFLTNNDLEDYVADLKGYADGIVADLELRRARLQSGVDYLGQRDGRWVPQIDVDAETDLDVKLAELDAASSSFGYEDFISGYLRNISVTSDLVAAENAASQAAYDGLADYCADSDGNIDLEGCGMSSDWSEYADSLVSSVNSKIRSTICEAELTLYYAVEDGISSATRTIDLGSPALASYLNELAGMGYVDGCPQFISPSFADLAALPTGTVAEALASLQRRLIDVELALSAIQTQTELMEANSYDAAVLGSTLESFESQQENLEKWVDGLLCAGAVFGAGVACVGTGAFTLTTSCVGAGIGAASACAALADDDWLDSDAIVTPEDVQIAFYQYSVALQDNASMAALAGILDAYVGAGYDYGDAALHYQTAAADFSRAIAITNTTMAGMYDDPALDPTAWFFQDQELAAMKASFQSYARDVRAVHRLLEYSTGHAISEGLVLPLDDRSFCLPRLADITVFKTYGGDFPAALTDLAAGSCDDPSPGELNLVAMGSVLAEISVAFESVYGFRATHDAWVVGTLSALGGLDRDGDGDRDLDDDAVGRARNPGEWELLSDSGFYDPNSYVDADSDHDGITCPTGTIDLDDICTRFTGGTVVHDDTCFDPLTLGDLDRLNAAFLDHVVRGVGVETFACTRSGTAPSYTYTVTRAVPEFFTYAQLGGTPTWLTAATGNEDWFEDIPNGITQGYYDAQTRVVRRIYDRYFAEVIGSGSVLPTAEDARSLAPDALNRVPGTTLFLLDTPSGFDAEVDLITGDIGASTTMAEQLVSLAFLCVDDHSCSDPAPHEVDLVFLGPAYQGDRYAFTSGRQEQVAYEMGPHVLDAAGSWSTKATDLNTPEAATAIESILAAPNVQSAIGRRPLHTSGMILAVAGSADSDGGVYGDAGSETRWALYHSVDPTGVLASRFQIKVRYSSYGTSADQTSDYRALATLLPCVSGLSHLISDPTVSCTLVSDY